MKRIPPNYSSRLLTLDDNMPAFTPEAYGPAFAELLESNGPNSLGPGRPHDEVKPKLDALSVEKAFAHASVADEEMARCCLSGLYLLHDFLDESHSISQDVPTQSGSYWHGIMHRREPDFSNAKYWFRRTAEHPIFPDLHHDSQRYASRVDLDIEAGFLKNQASWDPFAFVDLCEAALRGRSHMEEVCQRIAQQEWRLLFDYCYRAAVGDASA